MIQVAFINEATDRCSSTPPTCDIKPRQISAGLFQRKHASTLPDLMAVFRGWKPELGMRPIDHQIKRRVSGHPFGTA